MRISEIFFSIQGEGKLVGAPSAFIRTTGCNLRCVWCDTPYTSWEPEAGEALPPDQIVTRLRKYPTRFAVITGGEPMIDPDVGPLTQALKRNGYHVTIETAATVWQDVACDLASISPKLSNSTPHDRAGGKRAEAHDRQRISLPVIRRFMQAPDYQLKFVVDQPQDLVEIDSLLEAIGPVAPENVLLMPQGVTTAELDARASWVAAECKTRGFRYCPRLQIALFGNTRGT